ncbi:hypothetical protein [Anaerostipes sp. AF04-45]|nr:hypothetical protein [Anaerostipes sp. AF04-45]
MGKHIVSMMLAALIGLGASVQEIRERNPSNRHFLIKVSEVFLTKRFRRQ